MDKKCVLNVEKMVDEINQIDDVKRVLYNLGDSLALLNDKLDELDHRLRKIE